MLTACIVLSFGAVAKAGDTPSATTPGQTIDIQVNYVPTISVDFGRTPTSWVSSESAQVDVEIDWYVKAVVNDPDGRDYIGKLELFAWDSADGYADPENPASRQDPNCQMVITIDKTASDTWDSGTLNYPTSGEVTLGTCQLSKDTATQITAYFAFIPGKQVRHTVSGGTGSEGWSYKVKVWYGNPPATTAPYSTTSSIGDYGYYRYTEISVSGTISGRGFPGETIKLNSGDGKHTLTFSANDQAKMEAKATDLSDGTNTIPATTLEVSNDDSTYVAITAADTYVEYATFAAQDSGTSQTAYGYWKCTIPNPQPGGVYQGTVTYRVTITRNA
jgi:hypothetical protein